MWLKFPVGEQVSKSFCLLDEETRVGAHQFELSEDLAMHNGRQFRAIHQNLVFDNLWHIKVHYTFPSV
jgi:hypothetical protein